MNNTYINISSKIEDQNLINALFEIKKVTDFLDISFFVVGAKARDFIFEYCFDKVSPQRTEDLDLGVSVENWHDFNKLRESLIGTGIFFPARDKQRIIYGDVLIDIVPFGPISGKEKKISWPPENEVIMNTLGFEEAYKYALTVCISEDPKLDIKVPSIPGMALLKLVAWNDNPDRKRDTRDLLFIMDNYEDAGLEDRLWDEEQSMLIEEAYETKLAAIRLLGRDMASISNTDTKNLIIEILKRQTDDKSNSKLVFDMLGPSLRLNFDETFNKVLKLREGFFEVAKGE